MDVGPKNISTHLVFVEWVIITYINERSSITWNQSQHAHEDEEGKDFLANHRICECAQFKSLSLFISNLEQGFLVLTR